MTIKEAKEWVKTFRGAKFKCIAPNQVLEALKILNKHKMKGISMT